MHADIIFRTEPQRLCRDLREAVQYNLPDFVNGTQLIGFIFGINFQTITAPPDTRTLRHHME